MPEEPPEDEPSVSVDPSGRSDRRKKPWYPFLLWYVVFPGIVVVLLLSVYLWFTYS